MYRHSINWAIGPMCPYASAMMMVMICLTPKPSLPSPRKKDHAIYLLG